MTVKEEFATSTPQPEPDIDINEPSNEPPLVQATFAADDRVGTSSTHTIPVASASTTGQAATTTTTTYTVPAPAPNMAGASTNAAAGTNIDIGFLERGPQKIQCPYCNVNTVTHPRQQIDCVTVVVSILIVLLFWPLFWLPFVIPCCKATEHYCGSCHRKVGRTPPCQ